MERGSLSVQSSGRQYRLLFVLYHKPILHEKQRLGQEGCQCSSPMDVVACGESDHTNPEKRACGREWQLLEKAVMNESEKCIRNCDAMENEEGLERDDVMAFDNERMKHEPTLFPPFV
ncbi:hypothetical protein PV328_003198 [Microctonus aethiopoides]|uniref:Uncharacterized protein n=1 Tax=Microctonus aethiopoides TaxID=144406 RepID=A0AA39F7W1_9HYME|nr:hypothetical protein PV328_003198 [Microctonus aethiopoides]